MVTVSSEVISTLARDIYAYISAIMKKGRPSIYERSILAEAYLCLESLQCLSELPAHEQVILKRARKKIHECLWRGDSIFYFSSFYYLKPNTMRKSEPEIQKDFQKVNLDTMAMLLMDVGYIDIIRRARELNMQVKLLDGVETSTETVMVDRDNFDILITDDDLRKKVKKLFCDGHHARAVEEAFKYLDNTVSRVAKLKRLSGSALMKKAFSANDPIIKLNSGISESEQNEQLGYMEIFSGVMTGIRNPRAHDSDWEDTEERALQLLVIANHLICKVKATLTND